MFFILAKWFVYELNSSNINAESCIKQINFKGGLVIRGPGIESVPKERIYIRARVNEIANAKSCTKVVRKSTEGKIN